MKELVKVTSWCENSEVAKPKGDECPNHMAEVAALQSHIQQVERELER